MAREKDHADQRISGAFRTETGTVVFRDQDIQPRLQPHMRTRRGIAAQLPDSAAVQKHDGCRKPDGRASTSRRSPTNTSRRATARTP